jgi:hypothetical protein
LELPIIKNEAFRTEKVNFVFAVNAELNNLSEEDINKQGGKKATLSHLVGRTGFEPATPWSQTTYSTGLNYLPLINQAAANIAINNEAA